MADHQQPRQQEMNAFQAGGLDLPLGFRFHATDDEIVIHYLTNKVRDKDYTCITIGEVDLNNTEPWNLPDEAKWGEEEWYFFYQKDHMHSTGLRANRATKAGYWKATGKDKEVYNTTKGLVLLVGMKKTLVFYKGRAPRGRKTNWVMHEYRLEGSAASTSSSTTNAVVAMKASTSACKDEWVVCRVFDKTTRIKKTIAPAYQVAMVGTKIDQNQNNIQANPIPMQLPLPVPMSMPMQILPDFAMDPVDPYYHNADAGMPPMMQPMASIGGADGLQIDGALFGNPMDALSSMNFYHQIDMGEPADQMGMEVAAGQMGMGLAVGQMGMGAEAGQMDMGAVGVGGFDVAAPGRRVSSIVTQRYEQANASDISSMMSVTSPCSVNTAIEMDGIWKYKY